MRRWTIRILLCLILGVVTTVGVAWGFCVFFDVLENTSEFLSVEEARELYVSFAEVDAVDAPPSSFRGGRDRSAGAVTSYAISFDTSTSLLVNERTAGWPASALRGIVVERDDSTSKVISTHGAWILDWHNEVWLAARPILPGFIINTFFYAAIWFVLFFAIGFAKRTIRKKRGRCVKCGYDLRGTSGGGCPECGWNRQEEPLPSASARAVADRIEE